MNKTIEWFVFDFLEYEKRLGYKVDESYCRYGVYDRYVHREFQCSRKPTMTIQGYGFCTQHGKKIKTELGLDEF